MNPFELEHLILDNYPGVVVFDAYRERSFFFNPNRSLPRGIYFATIKESDGPNDKASHLDRQGVYRLSIGVGKKHFVQLFGEVPKRPAKGELVSNEVDFTQTGILMPHPIYAWLGWVCINNPTNHHVEVLKHLLDISYQNVFIKHRKMQ